MENQNLSETLNKSASLLHDIEKSIDEIVYHSLSKTHSQDDLKVFKRELLYIDLSFDIFRTKLHHAMKALGKK